MSSSATPVKETPQDEQEVESTGMTVRQEPHSAISASVLSESSPSVVMIAPAGPRFIVDITVQSGALRIIDEPPSV
jgi:hypothetical protein